jgi:hypothetical protein
MKNLLLSLTAVVLVAACAHDNPSTPAVSATPVALVGAATSAAGAVTVINRNRRPGALPSFQWNLQGLTPAAIVVLHQNGSSHSYPGVDSAECGPRAEMRLGQAQLPVVIRRECRSTWNSFTGPDLFIQVHRQSDGMMLARYLQSDPTQFQVLLVDRSFGLPEAEQLIPRLR